jgi:hypothetical protein
VKTWKVTLIRTDEVEAQSRQKAIDKILQNHNHELSADTIEARQTRKH